MYRPWPHSCFWSLQQDADTTTLDWVWNKVHDTVWSGHGVVVLLQDSDDKKWCQKITRQLKVDKCEHEFLQVSSVVTRLRKVDNDIGC